MVGILGICSAISICLSLFLNDIDYVQKEDGIKIVQIGNFFYFLKNWIFFQILFLKVKNQANQLKLQLLNINQLLAIPINLMSGFFLTFIWVDFTRVNWFNFKFFLDVYLCIKSFAACSAGLDYIGWSTMVLYAVAAIFSPIFGKLATAFS